MHGEDFVGHMNLRTIVPISDYFEGFSQSPKGHYEYFERWVLIGLKLMLPSMKQGDDPNHQMRFFGAVLLQLVPENLEEHLELNIQRFDTYSKMRAEVISFLEQKVSKSLIDDGGAAPMELDYVGGKGKGKKGKDKGGSVRTCYYCNKPGHLAKDCWQNPKGERKE